MKKLFYLSFFLFYSHILYANQYYMLVKYYKTHSFQEQTLYVLGLSDHLKSQMEATNTGNAKKILSCITSDRILAHQWTQKLNTFIKENSTFYKHPIDDYCVVDIYGQVVVNECFKH